MASVFGRCQLFCNLHSNDLTGGGGSTFKSPFSLKVRDSFWHSVSWVICSPQTCLPNATNVTDDRQTDRQIDHTMEKWIEIGRIACAKRPIPHKTRDETVQWELNKLLWHCLYGVNSLTWRKCQIDKPLRYVTSHPGPLSLAIFLSVGAKAGM